MARYYGVIRNNSPDSYLAHYGIRGMKWGVRKARESGNNLRLTYHYLRAKAKLRKLNHESNWYIHDVKGDMWGKLHDSKHLPGKVLGKLTAAGIRQKIHYLQASDAGDLYMDRRRDKFKEAMNEAFRGTKYDQQQLAREKNLKRARRSKKFKAIRRKVGLG